MADIQIKKCDKCGKEARNDGDEDIYNKGFEVVKIEIGGYHSSSYSYIGAKRWHLCEKCLKPLGIIRKKPNEKAKSIDTIGDQLYDFIANIVQDNLNNQ